MQVAYLFSNVFILLEFGLLMKILKLKSAGGNRHSQNFELCEDINEAKIIADMKKPLEPEDKMKLFTDRNTMRIKEAKIGPRSEKQGARN